MTPSELSSEREAHQREPERRRNRAPRRRRARERGLTNPSLPVPTSAPFPTRTRPQPPQHIGLSDTLSIDVLRRHADLPPHGPSNTPSRLSSRAVPLSSQWIQTELERRETECVFGSGRCTLGSRDARGRSVGIAVSYGIWRSYLDEDVALASYFVINERDSRYDTSYGQPRSQGAVRRKGQEDMNGAGGRSAKDRRSNSEPMHDGSYIRVRGGP
ncbi:hypothetical protein PENSPDRAFT_737307 [Peniophora sp. CONT]|nr:hypothetical protein PENSPDRAFT_737307 [Peniophora sp. CONT]